MTTRLTESECLQCGKKLDAASYPTDDDLAPRPGDCTICIGCGYLMAFTDEMTLRHLTDDELKEVPLDEVSRFQRARKAVMPIEKSVKK